MDVDVYWSNRSRNCSQIIKTYCCCSFSSLACTRTRAQWIQILACNRERICLLRVIVCANRITLFVYRVWCTEVMRMSMTDSTLLSPHSLTHRRSAHTHAHTPNVRSLLLSARAFPLILTFSFYFKSEFTEKIFSQIPHIGIFIRPLRHLRILNL